MALKDRQIKFHTQTEVNPDNIERALSDIYNMLVNIDSRLVEIETQVLNHENRITALE